MGDGEREGRDLISSVHIIAIWYDYSKHNNDVDAWHNNVQLPKQECSPSIL